MSMDSSLRVIGCWAVLGCASCSGGDEAASPPAAITAPASESPGSSPTQSPNPALVAAAAAQPVAPVPRTSAPPPSQPGLLEYITGLDQLQKGRFDDAVASFAAAIDADDENADYLTARGVARALAEDMPGALKDLNRSLRLRDGDRETRLWIGVALAMSNQHMEASNYFTHGRDLPADYASFVFNEMAREYSSSRYEGEYYDLATNQRVQTSSPQKRHFPRAAQMFVARHKKAGMDAPANATLANALAGRVRQQVERGEYAAAISDARSLLDASPDDSASLLLHARCALGLGDALIAREQLTRVLTANTTDAEAYLLRARAAAIIGDQRRAQADLAIASALGAANLEREQSEIQRMLRDALAADSDPVQALTTLRDKAARGAPPAELLSAALAVQQSANNRRLRCDEAYQDRLRVLKAELARSPRNADRLAALADFLYQQSSVMREKVEPRATPRLFRWQTSHSQQAELDRSLQACDEALAVDAQHIGAMTTKAAVLASRGLYGDAQIIVQNALRLSPNDPRLLQMMASLLDVAAGQRSAQAAGLRETKTWYDGDWMYTRWPSRSELAEADALSAEARRIAQLAAEQLELAVAALGDSADGFYLRGVLARSRGELEQARADLEAAARLEPDSVDAWQQLAAIYSDLNLPNDSVLARSRAANLVQTTAAHLLVLAQLHINRTAFRSALEALDQAMQVDPADPRTLAYVAVLEEAREKPEQALAAWRAALALVEARAVLHGHPLHQGRMNHALALDPDDLGLLLCTRIRLARLMDAQGQLPDAAALCEATLDLTRNLSPDLLVEPMPAATLPDPEGDLHEIPLAQPPALFVGWARIIGGNAALARGDADAAIKQFQAAQTLEREWPSTKDGRQVLMEINSRARLGLAKAALVNNDVETAWRALMEASPRNFPPDLQQEYRSIQEEVTRRRRDG